MGGLGCVAAGVDIAFEGGWSYGDDGASGGGSFKTKGMKRRKVESLEQGQKLLKEKGIENHPHKRR